MKKVILITDYKNYKKYSSKIENLITWYNFEKDLRYFFKRYFKYRK